MNHIKKDEEVPEAKIKNRRHISPIWLVPLCAAIAAGWLIFQYLNRTGAHITIVFSDANGLQANQSVLKYRGVRVGNVESIAITPDTELVEVHARLDRSAKNLARNGSHFWVVRPEVGSTGLRGLETIVSGPYIGVQPGDGKPQTKFVGDAQPPRITRADGKFEIIVTTPQIHTLSVGSPVYYRGVEVGKVSYFVLSEEARQVDVHLLIDTNFAPLVRVNSRFWNAGGISFDWKFLSLYVSAENVKSLIIGGIAFATPPELGAQASPGTIFALAEKPDEKWTEWAPAIPVVNSPTRSPESSPSDLLMNSVNSDSSTK